MHRFRDFLLLLPFAVICSTAQDSSPTFHGNNQRTGRTSNVGPTVPVLRWSFQAAAPIEASAVTASGGTIFVCATDGRLHALTPGGNLKWTFAAQEAAFGTPAIAPDDSILFADLSGCIYSVSAGGLLKWVYALDDGPPERRIVAPALVLPNGQSVFASWNDRIYSIGADGKLIWRLALDGAGQISAAPALDTAGNMYIAAHDTANKDRLAIYKLDPLTGTLIWKSSEDMGVNRNRVISSPAIDVDRGRLYVGVAQTDDGAVHAFNLSNGTRAFRTILPKGVVSSPALGRDGAVYVGCMDGSLYALDPAGAGIRWQFITGAYYVPGSPMVDGAGNIFFGDSEGYIYAVSPSGQELWRRSTRSCISAAPVIGSDGTLYVTSQDSTIYAFSQRRRQSGRP